MDLELSFIIQKLPQLYVCEHFFNTTLGHEQSAL